MKRKHSDLLISLACWALIIFLFVWAVRATP